MNIYLILKSLHLIAVISWMAGLLYLPRIFVYHSENKLNNDISGVFKVMERRLYFYIMYPAMLLSWIFGVSIIHFQGIELLKAKWFLIKIIAVIILTGYHFYLVLEFLLKSCLYRVLTIPVDQTLIEMLS